MSHPEAEGPDDPLGQGKSSGNDTSLFERLEEAFGGAGEVLAASPLLVDWSGASRKGDRRTVNEDCFGFVPLGKGVNPKLGRAGGPDELTLDSPSPLPCAFAVADGMGGAPAGERASLIAVGTVLRYLSEETALLAEPAPGGDDVAETFRHGLWHCRAWLGEEERERPAERGMATTLTAAVALGSELHVIHVGDSRAQLFRDGRLRTLTREHTVAQGLLEGGTLSAEAARISPWRRVLDNYLCADRSDLYADTLRVRILPGDVFLLSTDGVAGALPDPEVERILSSGADARGLCREFTEACRERGARDDSTVLVAAFRPGP